ncbi:hypothetical protein LIA77_08137 [Sarocladium implicatum]|nr:hypothetical protein LIA77_08137 [Sarocladium implicatum]
MPSPMEKLPIDVLKEIFDYLETPSHIEAHLEHDPSKVFDQNSYLLSPASKDLKNAALVSRAWSMEARPRLIRHVHIHLPLGEVSLNTQNGPRTKDLETVARFFKRNETLAPLVQSVTVCIKPPSRDEGSALDKTRATINELAGEANVDISRLADFISSASERGRWLDRKINDLFILVLKLSPSRLTIVATGMTLHTCFHGNLYFNPLVPNIWSPRLRLLSLSGQGLVWKEKPTDDSWRKSTPYKTAWVPLRKLLTMAQWNDLVVNEGRFTLGCIQGDFFDSQGASVRAALRKLKRSSANETYTHVTGLTCVDGYFLFKSIGLYGEMSTIFGRLERFCFRARPIRRAARTPCEPGVPVPQVNAQVERSIVSPDVLSEAECSLRDLVEKPKNLHKTYEFPDLGRGGKWQDMARIVEAATGRLLVAQRPGVFVPR